MASSCDISLDITMLSEETLAKLKLMSKAMNKRGKESKFPFATVTRSEDSDGKKNEYAEALAQLFGTGKVDKIGQLQAFVAKESLSTYKKVRSLFSSTNSKALQKASKSLSLLNNAAKDRTIDELIENATVMTVVLGSMQDSSSMLADVESDAVSASRDGMTRAEREATSPLNGIVDMEQLASVVGKSILRSRMKKAKGTVEQTLFEYVKAGEEAISRAVEDGLIEVVDAYVPATSLLTEDGEYLDGTVGLTSGQHKGRARKGRGIKLNTTTGKFGENKELLEEVNENTVKDLYSTLKVLGNIITPITEALPTSDARDSDENIDDIVATKEGTRVRNNMQKGSVSVNRSLIGVFEEFKKLWDKAPDEENFKKTVIKKYGSMFKNSDNFMMDVFGLKLNKVEDSLLANSERSQETTAFGPLISMMQNYDKLFVDENGEAVEFHHSTFYAGTGRMFLNETVMQYQSDSKMQRHIQESSTPVHYNTYDNGSGDLDYLVRQLASTSGIPIDVITGRQRGSKLFEGVIRNLDADKPMMALAKLSDNLEGTLITSGKIWEQMKVLSLITEIRDEVEYGNIEVDANGTISGSMETSYLMESDATASGIQFKIIQNAYNENSQNALLRMGIGLDGEVLEQYKNKEITLAEAHGYKGSSKLYEGTYIEDSYHFGLEVMEANYKKYNAEKIKVTEEQEKLGYKGDKLNSMVALELTEYAESERIDQLMQITGKTLRDVLKYFIMKVAYGQSDENNALDFAKEVIFENLEDIDKVNKILALYEVHDEDGKLIEVVQRTMNKAQQIEISDKIIDKMTETTGQYIAEQILEGIYSGKLFEGTSTDMSTIASHFNALPAMVNDKGNEIVSDTGSMMSPLLKTVVMKKMDMERDQTTPTLESVEGDYNYFDQMKSRKYLMGMDKLKEVLIHSSKDPKKKAIISAKMFNVTSWMVLPTHMKDAATLVLALDDTYKQIIKDANTGNLNAKKDKEAFEAMVDQIMSDNPVLPVHDAITMSPKYMRLAEDNMQKRMLDVSYYYDEILEAIKEYETRLNYNSDTKVTMSKELEELKLKYLQKMKDKQEFLSQFKVIDEQDTWNGEWRSIESSFRVDTSDRKMAKVSEAFEIRAKNRNEEIGEIKEVTPSTYIVPKNRDTIEFMSELEVGKPATMVVFDYETSLDMDDMKEDGWIENRKPVEVAAQRVTLTLQKDGSVVKKNVGEPFHKVRKMTKDEAKINQDTINSNTEKFGAYYTSKTLNAIYKKAVEVGNGVKTKEDITSELGKFVKDDDIIITFSGTGFDVPISGLSNKHYDLREIARSFKDINERDAKNSTGTQSDFFDTLVEDKQGIDVSKAHTAQVDIEVATMLMETMATKLSQETDTKEGALKLYNTQELQSRDTLLTVDETMSRLNVSREMAEELVKTVEGCK